MGRWIAVLLGARRTLPPNISSSCPKKAPRNFTHSARVVSSTLDPDAHVEEGDLAVPNDLSDSVDGPVHVEIGHGHATRKAVRARSRPCCLQLGNEGIAVDTNDRQEKKGLIRRQERTTKVSCRNAWRFRTENRVPWRTMANGKRACAVNGRVKKKARKHKANRMFPSLLHLVAVAGLEPATRGL